LRVRSFSDETHANRGHVLNCGPLELPKETSGL
jgi:hypothetical protein